jgi:Flp pilus assembly protein TadD
LPVDVRDLESARDSFRSALRVQPLEALAEAGLGLVHTRLGEMEPARSHLRKARFLAPARWDLPLCLGNVEYLSEDYEGAAALYHEALRLHPGWYEATKNLALAYEKLGRPFMARELWLTLVRHPRIGEEARRHVDELKG